MSRPATVGDVLRYLATTDHHGVHGLHAAVVEAAQQLGLTLDEPVPVRTTHGAMVSYNVPPPEPEVTGSYTPQHDHLG